MRGGEVTGVSHSRSQFAFSTSRVDDALAVGGDVFYPHRYRSVPDPAFVMRLAGATTGPFTTATLSYETELAMDVDRLGAYHVNVPVAGFLTTRTERGEVVATPSCASVYRPTDAPSLRFDGTPVLAARFDAAYVEDQMDVVTGRSSGGVVPLPDALPLGEGAGAAWWAMMRTLQEPAVLDALGTQPLFAAPFVDALARCLIGLTPAAAATPSSAGRSTALHACELVDERPEEPWTVTQLARAANVGVRNLQLAFAHHVGCTPMQYVTRVRLERAHRELVDAEPGTTTVAAVATRWGFVNFGRFAAAHVERYGCTPSAALRGRPGT